MIAENPTGFYHHSGFTLPFYQQIYWFSHRFFENQGIFF